MTTYIALLRGINVSGHNMIKMADLKALLESLGLADVRTYIQSGNVLFRSDEAVAALRGRIEQAIAERFGMDVPVVLRTAEELEQIVANSPFPPHALKEGEHLAVTLLAEPPSAEGISRLAAFDPGIDEYRLVGTTVYLLYRQSTHKSRLTNNSLEQKLKVAATSRNWQTMNKLAELARSGD